MQLVRIVHHRCGDYDGSEYVLAPEDWDEELIHQTIDLTMKEAIADARALKEPPFGKPAFFPDYDAHPDKTVAEVKRLHEERKAEYLAWRERNDRMTRSFVQRLVDAGFTTLWGAPEAVEHEAHWGHAHGLELGYKRSEF